MKTALLLLAMVLMPMVAGADIQVAYEVVSDEGKITTTRTDVETYSLEGLLQLKARYLRDISNYNEQKASCDIQIAERNAKIVQIDTLISQIAGQ